MKRNPTAKAERLLVLALAAALTPACGGGGGGGGGGNLSGGISMPTLPAIVAAAPAQGMNSTPPLFAPATLDTSAAVATVNATNGRTDAQVEADLTTAIQNLGAGGGRITFSVTGGTPRTVVFSGPITVSTTTKFTIDGGNNGTNNLIVLSGANSTNLFTLENDANVTYQQLDFIDARAAQSGGAINGLNQLSGLTVINCNFTNCQTLEAGSDIGGGAIRAPNSAQTIISGCTFTNCAGSNGGAVNSLGSPLTLVECNFIQNAAFGTGGGNPGNGGIGGAVYVDNVSTNGTNPVLGISGCLFNANVANEQGGAVFGYMIAGSGSTTKIDATTFAGNQVVDSANAGGGGLYSLNETLILTNSTFNSNSSASVAGGLRCDNSTVTVTNCTFEQNSTGGFGGAIARFTGTSTQLTLQNVTVDSNTAGQWGAGLYWLSSAGASAAVYGSIFSNNTGTNAFNGWQSNVSVNGAGNLQWPSVTGPTENPVSTTGTTLGNPALGALGNNTGPTYTMAIVSPNPAIGLATGAGSPPATDQTGFSRGGSPDAGAFQHGTH